MNEYYIAKPGTQQPMGPMNVEQIRMGMQQGSITPDCVYCTPEMPQWKPLNTLPGLTPAGVPMGVPQPMGGGMPYGQVPMQPQPNNYLVWSILVTVLCCVPFGIVAIIKSNEVNTFWAQGRVNEAKQAAEAAKKWCIYGVVGSVIGIILYILLIAVSVAAD